MKNAILLLIFVFGLAATAQGQVLSENKPIEAISEWSADFSAANANDGDPNTRWASNGDEGDKWITIDLGEVSDIGAVKIIWEAAYGKNFTIDVSDDKLDWTNAATITDHASAGEQEITGLSAKGRYVRLTVTEGAYTHLSIFEFIVYGAEGVVVPVVTADVISANKPASTSSIYSEGFEGALAVDGDMATRWASSSTAPHWMCVNLGSVYDIDSAHIAWESAFGKNFTIEVSYDSIDWTVAKTITDAESGGMKSYTDLNATGKFIRLSITEGAMGHVSIFEFSVFGSVVTLDPISLNKSASESSFWAAGFEGSFAVDGDKGTRWASSGDEVPHWLMVDLEDTYSIDSIQIEWEAAYATDFTIDVSADALTWTAAKTVVSNASGGAQSLTDISAEGRFVRLHITKTLDDYAHVSIFEFSVFGTMGGTSGIKDINKNDVGICVFPNPTAGVFRVKTNSKLLSEIQVYKLDGSLVYSNHFVESKLIESSDFGSKGIFVVKVTTENNIYTEKIIVK